MISNQINPYADSNIREADDLLRLTSRKEKEMHSYAEEAYKLYVQAVQLDSTRTDGYMALASMSELLSHSKMWKLTTLRSIIFRNSWQVTSEHTNTKLR